MAYYFQLAGTQAESAMEQMIAQLKSKAKQSLKTTSDDDIIVRPLRPEDVGLSTPEWTFNIASANAWNLNQLNTTIADNRWIGINGILYAMSSTQAVTQLKVKRAGQNKRYWQVQGINFLENASIFFSDPVIIEENTNLTVDMYAIATGSTEKIIFLGAVVEKKGILTR